MEAPVAQAGEVAVPRWEVEVSLDRRRRDVEQTAVPVAGAVVDETPSELGFEGVGAPRLGRGTRAKAP